MLKNFKRMHWQMGQMLLPHHLSAQEEALLTHAHLGWRECGLPFYGLSALVWKEELLKTGIVALDRLVLLLPEGQWLGVPDNAEVTTLDLTQQDKGQVTVYLHLLTEVRVEETTLLLRGEAASGWQSCRRLVLSCSREVAGSEAIFKLAECERQPDDTWQISRRYIPPCITLFINPFLEAPLQQLRQLLAEAQRGLEQQLDQALWIGPARLEAKLCFGHIARLKRLLTNRQQEVVCHPYSLYEQLSQLIDFLQAPHGCLDIAYTHVNLSTWLQPMLQQLEQALLYKAQETRFVKFEKSEGLYVIDALPSTLLQAHEVYLVIHKPDSQDAFALKNSKLTSRLRLLPVRQFALPGVPLQPVKSTQLGNQGFSSEAAVYTVTREDEWHRCIAEGNLVFFSPELTDAYQLFLYWR